MKVSASRGDMMCMRVCIYIYICIVFSISRRSVALSTAKV